MQIPILERALVQGPATRAEIDAARQRLRERSDSLAHRRALSFRGAILFAALCAITALWSGLVGQSLDATGICLGSAGLSTITLASILGGGVAVAGSLLGGAGVLAGLACLLSPAVADPISYAMSVVTLSVLVVCSALLVTARIDGERGRLARRIAQARAAIEQLDPVDDAELPDAPPAPVARYLTEVARQGRALTRIELQTLRAWMERHAHEAENDPFLPRDPTTETFYTRWHHAQQADPLPPISRLRPESSL